MTPLTPGTELTCSVDAAAFEGKSVARIEGFVVFVDGAVPGDEAVIRIRKKKKNYAEASLVTLLAPSPLREKPRCSHFGTCGGCRWQHVRYEEQLRFKSQHVLDCFVRLGGLSGYDVLPILGCDSPFFYRNKMEFSFADRAWTTEKPSEDVRPDPGVHLGLHVPGRFDKVLDIQACYLQSELSNAILTFTREFARRSGLPVYHSASHAGYWRFVVIRQSKRSAQCMVNIVTFEDKPELMRQYSEELGREVEGVTTVVNTINDTRSQVAFGRTTNIYKGEGRITERLGSLTFDVSPQSFFQTNTEQAERLYSTAIEAADLRQDDVVYDLYSGTGTIALFMAGRVKQVLGIESVEQSVRDAERNAASNGISNCTFMVGDLKDALSAHLHETLHPRVVVVDPPRSGMHEHAVRDVVRISPERIVYISCNPASQARDCKLFDQLGFKTVQIRPVDMFPHTFHIENVALLVKSSD